jgi:hypothetical protein
VDYFVSLIPSYESFWQIELLIESFKMLGMQDQLLIAVATNSETFSGPSNLLKHPRKIFFSDYNLQFKRQHPPINKILAVIAAYDQLSPCFAMLHTDMILCSPVPLPEEWPQNIVFHPYPAKETKVKFSPGFSWLGFDGVVRFNDVPREFFERTVVRTEALLTEHGPDWCAALTAWNLTANEYGNRFSFLGAHLEVPLSASIMLPIIHYKMGLPPYFTKHSFGEIRFTEEPYNALMLQNPTLNTDYVQHVIRSYKYSS